MNVEQLRKSVGQRVQLRPSAISIDHAGRVAVHDDVWLIDAMAEDDVRISLDRTGHFTHLGRDHIHHYTSNPDETRRTGVKHGFLTLNIQIFLRGPRLTVTPTFCPGELVMPDQLQPRTPAQAPTALMHSPIPVVLDLPYVQAREQLVAAGWQPLRQHWSFASDPQIQAGNGATFWAMGFHEIAGAMPTGLGHCKFVLRDVYGNTLVVITAGEENEEWKSHAIVWNWYFEKGEA